MKTKKKWIRTFLPVLAGFLALYLALTGIATYLIKETFMEQFETDFTAAIAYTETSLCNNAEYEAWLAQGNRTKTASNRYDYVLNANTRSYTAYFQLSFALFDEKRGLLSRSKNMLTFENPEPHLHRDNYPMDDYLNPDELKELAHYVYLQYECYCRKWDPSYAKKGALSVNSPMDYRITMAFERGSNIPAQIIVQEMNSSQEQGSDESAPEESNAGTESSAAGSLETDGSKTDSSEASSDSQTLSGYEQFMQITNRKWEEHSTIVWTWTNPDIDISRIPQDDFVRMECFPGSTFPYLSLGYDPWLSWQENSFLQNLQLDRDLFYTQTKYNAAAIEFPPFQPQTKRVSEIFIPQDDTLAGPYYLVAAVDCHPWLAAMDYMKYFYLLGFACMLVCAGVLAFAIHRTNLRRDALEENRRDFTNAIAHELKTPLCAIRGYAENLKEDTVQEKREHYLDQIILKTEEMDGLAAEMIYVSRLDSEKLVLKKEPVCLNDLIQAQLEKLDDVISKKNLLVWYQAEEEFHVTGDRKYLEKAVCNLLSNAISYNTESGTIRIIVGRDRCSMENTGEHIPEADLPHVFEMFYSGQGHFGDEEKHLGMGLYLTRKICALHHLTLTVQNTEMGVRAEISL